MTLGTKDGKELASQIEGWLSLSRQGAPSQELAKFIADLKSGSNIGIWAGVNFERILPFSQRKSRLTRILTLSRNSLVFLPILLTWWGVRDAVRAFSTAEVGDNFLVFWQNLDGFTKLSTIALIDVAIILAVIVLTIAVGILEEDGTYARKLQREYEGLMVSLERKLSGYRYLSLEDLNLVAEGTLGALLESTKEMQQATNSFSAAAANVHQAVVDIGDITRQVIEPVSQRSQDLVTLLHQATQMHQEMAQLSSSFEQSLTDQAQRLNSEITSAMGQLKTGFSSSIGIIETSLASSVRDMTVSADMISVKIADEISNQLGAFAKTLEQVGDDIRAATSDVAETAATIQSGAVVLRADLLELHEALTKVVSS